MFFNLLLATAESPKDLSIFSPVSPSAISIQNLAYLVLAICFSIFLIVEAILLYSIVRFRQKKSQNDKEPPQVYGSVPVEIAWTAAPTLIVFILVLVTTRTLWEVEVAPPEPKTNDHTLFVRVIGRQWWWEYQYQYYDGKKLNFFTANELHAPASDKSVDRPVFLTLESADVCHSYWVPRLAGKTDLIPGKINHMWFQTDQNALFVGQCAEYCGTQHAGMLLRVEVEPKDEFEIWLENQAKPAIENPDLVDAKKLFLSLSCIDCHRVRGTTANGSYAPDLTHLMSRQTLASGLIPNTRENLRAWIADPQKIKPGVLMPAFQLTDQELDLLVDYLVSLK